MNKDRWKLARTASALHLELESWIEGLESLGTESQSRIGNHRIGVRDELVYTTRREKHSELED